jgi:hypothetical protein
MLAGQEGQPRHGVLVDPDQSGGLADAAALGEVLKDGQHLVARQLGVEERRALELGEAALAGPAVEQPVSGLSEVVDDEQVAVAPAAVEVAVGVLAAEAGEVVRGHGRSWTDPGEQLDSWMTSLSHWYNPIQPLADTTR